MTTPKLEQSDSEESPSTPCSASLVVLPTDSDPDGVKSLREGGYLVILTDKPEAVRMMSVESVMPAGDVVVAALRALNLEGAGNERRTFIAELYRRLSIREQND